MPRVIEIPIYDHTPKAEIEEILECLKNIGLDGATLVHKPAKVGK